MAIFSKVYLYSLERCILYQEHHNILRLSRAKVKGEEFSNLFYQNHVLTPLEMFKICESVLRLYPDIQTRLCYSLPKNLLTKAD